MLKFAFAVAALLVSCSTRIAQGAGEGRNPVVIVVGGYQSCPKTKEILRLPVPTITDIAAAAVAPGSRAYPQRGASPRYLFGCYTGLLGASMGRIEFRYSPDPRFKAFRSIPIDSRRLSDPKPLEPFFEFLRAEISAVPRPETYLVGHSYGAWTAIHAAGILSRSLRIGGLATLDPISPVRCKPDALIYNMLARLRSPSGCQSAPPDLFESDLSRLGLSLPWWLNFYQTQFRFVHSSAISAIEAMNADPAVPKRGYNLLVRMRGTNPFFNDHHSNLSVHSDAWRTISSFISSAVAAGQGRPGLTGN